MLKNNGFMLEKGLLSFEDKYSLAKSFTTIPQTLECLANAEDLYVRYWVAANPSTLPETLERLAYDESWVVRENVVDNSITPQYIRTYLKIKEFLNYYE